MCITTHQTLFAIHEERLGAALVELSIARRRLKRTIPEIDTIGSLSGSVDATRAER